MNHSKRLLCCVLLFVLYSHSIESYNVKNTVYPVIEHHYSRHYQRSINYASSLRKSSFLTMKATTKPDGFQPLMPEGSTIPPSSATSAITNTNEANTQGSIISGNSQGKWIARIILLTVSAFYGTNFGCVKVLGEAIHPGVAACLRFFIASLVFLPQVISVAKTNRKILFAGMEIGFYNAIGYFGQAQSLLTSKASNVAFICSLAVVVVPFIESIFGEKRGWSYLKSALFPALLAVAGVGCLELGGSTAPGLGDFWALLQPLFFGYTFWKIERHIKMCTKPGDAQAYTGAAMGAVAVMSVFWMIHDFIMPVSIYGKEIFDISVQSQFQNIINDWKVPAALLWTGIVTTALTSYGENVAMKDLDAAESTVIYSTEPLWGTAFAALTLGEDVGWNTLVGALLIIGACLWSSLGGKFLALLSSTPFFANNVVVEEITENIGNNINTIIDNINNEL